MPLEINLYIFCHALSWHALINNYSSVILPVSPYHPIFLFFHPLWASCDIERPSGLVALANSMRVGLTGGRSLVISSTVLLLGQAPSGVGNGCRSSSVCGAPRPSLTPSSAGVKMGKGSVILFGSSWCSLTPLSTVPTLKTPEGQVCFSDRACHCRDIVSLRESSFIFIVCLQAWEKFLN